MIGIVSKLNYKYGYQKGIFILDSSSIMKGSGYPLKLCLIKALGLMYKKGN